VTGPTASTNASDNHFSVVIAGARSVRRRIHPLGAGGGDSWGWAASWHRPVFATGAPMVPGLRVESVTVVSGAYELRVHRVLGAPGGARVELTGWAVGEPLVSVLYPVQGWTGQDEVRAPQGTAFTPWARIPRLSADAHGTAIYAALAMLTEQPEPFAATVTGSTEDSIEVRWADQLTRIAFTPLTVTRL
jgi:hypothetical protein